MVTQETRVKLTYDDYAKTPEDERWELLDGELIMAAAPNMKHQSVQSVMGGQLQPFVMSGGHGWVFFSPTDVVLSEHDTVQPDLVFVSREREHIITDANIQGAPDLVVEILSPSTASRDWRDKLDLYERHGVAEYWLVDPVSEIVWVFQLVDGALVQVGMYSVGDTLTSPLLEGFVLDLGLMFGE